MNETTKLHLKKPEPEDFYDVGDFNGNADIIDEAISALQKGKAEANHTHSAATQSAAGMMSAADKKKLDIGDARTVGGHTVESDVPANATFTDTTDSDVVSGAAGFVSLDGLQGGVPFSGLLLDGDIAGQEVILRACGKNLIAYPYRYNSGKINGVDFTVNDNGSVAVNGTATANTNFYLCYDKQLNFPAGRYMMSGCPEGGSLSTYRMEAYSYSDDNKVIFSEKDVGGGVELDLTDDLHFGVRISIFPGVVCNGLIFYPQLERGSSATEYEPYHGSTVTVTPDCAPYTVPNDIRQQDGVNNVMVSAGTVQVTGVRSNRAIEKLWEKQVAASQSAAGMMSAADKKKLDGIAEGANKITVDSALSDSSANPVQNKVINAALEGKAEADHTHSAASLSVAGFMSAADKKKLDGIAAGANKYTLPNASASAYGGVKIGGNISVSGGVISVSRTNVNNAVGSPSATELGLHKCCVGTAEPDDTNCPAGAWYGKY